MANGSTRPRAVQFADWRITQPAEEQSSPQPVEPPAEPAVDLVAAAEAAAIRARTDAEVEQARLLAEAEAEAIRIKAAEEARKLALANNRNERKEAEEQAASEARIADHNRRREDAERARQDAAQAAEGKKAETKAREAEQAKAEDKWSDYARGFYIVCAIVALPVQVAAFYDPNALWLMAAPLMLEGGAWVVLKGAAAAVAARRPHWHYRLIAWLLAFIAAAINLWHGLNAFDPATAIATAFASIAGPGVWDLHEHGRIRKRDGALTRRERKTKKRAESRAEALKKLEEKAKRFEKEAADKAAAEAAAKLAADRESMFPDVWDHALGLAAALGETTVTDAVWRRAHKDVKGTDPGDSPEAQQLRNAAARRMLDARADAPEKTVWKIQDAQVNPQVPPTRRRGSVTGPPVRGTRRAGDTPKFVDAARKQAAITAKNAAQKDPS
jgi:chemotaxis protein histidine kinase CheA